MSCSYQLELCELRPRLMNAMNMGGEVRIIYNRVIRKRRHDMMIQAATGYDDIFIGGARDGSRGGYGFSRTSRTPEGCRVRAEGAGPKELAC